MVSPLILAKHLDRERELERQVKALEKLVRELIDMACEMNGEVGDAEMRRYLEGHASENGSSA